MTLTDAAQAATSIAVGTWLFALAGYGRRRFARGDVRVRMERALRTPSFGVDPTTVLPNEQGDAFADSIVRLAPLWPSCS
jgi:hypothetical protein